MIASYICNSDSLQIHRVRLNGVADGLRARLRFEAALADISSATLGLPPRVLLIVNHVAPTVRLRLDRSLVNDSFQQAVRNELQQKAKQAVRPWLNTDSTGAEAVLFADEAELIACLLRDSLRGTSAEQWWRQLVLGDLLVSAWWQRALLPRGELLPVVLSQLATEKLAIPWLASLQASEIAVALQAIVTAYRIDTLSAWLSFAPVQQTITHSTPSPDALTNANIAYQHLIKLIPELPTSVLTIPQQRLLALSLGLQRALTWTRSPAFLLALQTLETNNATLNPPTALSNQPSLQINTEVFADSATAFKETEFTEPSNTEFSKTTTVSKTVATTEYPDVDLLPVADVKEPEFTEHNDVKFFKTTRVLKPVATSEYPDADFLTEPAKPKTNRTVTVSKAWQVLEQQDNKARETEHATQDYRPCFSESNESYQEDTTVPSQLSSEITAIADSTLANEIAPFLLQGITTEFGGIFYLLNVALALELYGDFTQPRVCGIALSPWDWLALLGRAWFGAAFVKDPVWQLLAELSGRSTKQVLGDDFLPADSWLMSADWLLPWADADVLSVYVQRGRLQVWHPANFMIIDVIHDKTVNPMSQARQLCTHYECLNPARLMRVYRQPLSYRITQGGKLKQWLRCLLLYLHARLQRALGDDEPELLIKNVCYHTATIYCTASAVDVHLSLATLPIELRIAGLDRDPGWIPASGRTIAFHFQ